MAAETVMETVYITRPPHMPFAKLLSWPTALEYQTQACDIMSLVAHYSYAAALSSTIYIGFSLLMKR